MTTIVKGGNRTGNSGKSSAPAARGRMSGKTPKKAAMYADVPPVSAVTQTSSPGTLRRGFLAPAPVFKQYPFMRNRSRRLKSVSLYLQIAQEARKYAHVSMGYQRVTIEPAAIARLVYEMSYGDSASRAVSSVLLGYITASKMRHEYVFSLVAPAAELLMTVVTDLATQSLVPVSAGVDALQGVDIVLPYYPDQERVVDRLIEIVHSTIGILIDRRDAGSIDDAYVSRALTMMAGELIPVAVRSQYEVLGRLLREQVSSELRDALDNLVFRGMQSMRDVYDNGITADVKAVAGKSLASLVRACQHTGRLGTSAFPIMTLLPSGVVL